MPATPDPAPGPVRPDPVPGPRPAPTFRPAIPDPRQHDTRGTGRTDVRPRGGHA